MGKQYNVIDLFAGCGGLLEGFLKDEKKEFYPVASVEWDKNPIENLINRLKGYWGYKNASEKCLHMDMQQIELLLNGWENHKDYGSHMGLKKIVGKKKIDFIIGGPPCQAYSVAGRVRDEHAMAYDYRNYLFESYLKIVEEFQPKFFIFENVPGLLSAKVGEDKVSVTKLIAEAIEKTGYHIMNDLKDTVVDMSEYGVPQNRKRVIIVGLNKNYFKTPEITLNKFYKEVLPSFKESKTITLWDAIGDLPPCTPTNEFRKNGRNFSHTIADCDLKNHEPRFHNKGDIEIFKLLTKDIESGKNELKSAKEKNRLYAERTGQETKVHKYHVLEKNKPSTTILAHLYKDGLRFIHPESNQARSLTVRECARLQTFDDSYEFISALGCNYKMIGNAVPPKFSYVLGQAVKELLK